MKYGGFLPIYEKENAFAYFKSYDKIAIIDGDIFIRDSAPNLFDQITDEYDFAGVVEREMPLNQKYSKRLPTILECNINPFEMLTGNGIS